MGTFVDQVAVITGASSGVGKSIALALAKEGMNMCLVGRNKETLDRVAEEARTTTSHVLSCRADLTQDKDIQALKAFIQDNFQRVDVLVHSAGVIAQGPVVVAPVEDFDWQYQTNVRGPYLLTQVLLPWLKVTQGQVIFINSSIGLTAKGHLGPYAATKHALKAIADSLREEVNGDGLRVLSVFLGRTATPMQAAVHELEGRAYHPERLLQPEDVASVVLNALFLPRTAEVTDIHVRPFLKPG
jgi:short-subunit dehydrogenase